MNKLLVLTSTVSLFLLCTISAANDSIMIPAESAWARATPPGSSTTAIYLTLMNHSGSDIGLTAVNADISDRLELHTHVNKEGMMKMQQVTSIIIPAGSQAELRPHGDHIMVFNLKKQLKPDEEISVELTFDDGNTTTVTIPVHKESPMSGDDSMDHSEMQHDGKHKHMKNKDTDDVHQHDKTS